MEFKAREKEINAKEKELVRSQQIIARQQQTEEALQVHAHLNNLEAKLRQVTQEKADLQAQLRSFSGIPSPKQKLPRSNSMPITPSSTKKGKETEDSANENLINELTQK